MKELKECPFCGSEVKLTNIDPNDNYYMVECQNENCNAATCFGEIDEEEIKERWNRRVTDDVGNWFFLTQSEAEEKLRELEGIKCQN